MSISSFLWESYVAVPIVTRVCSTFTVLLAIALQLDLVTKYDLYYNPTLTFERFQLWRLLTPFFYIEKIDISFIFNILFPYRYCWHLESSDFLDRTEDFVLMLVFGMSMILVIGYWAGTVWLNQSLGLFILYIWSRRNPSIQVEIFGLVIFPAAYIPMFFFCLSVLFGNPTADLIGYLTGHMYYHAYFVFPNQPQGFHILRSPALIKRWFHPLTPPEEVVEDNMEESAPTIRQPPPPISDPQTLPNRDDDQSAA